MTSEPELSQQTRAAGLQRLEREEFDVLILGGGITGAGVAREAALRGLSVALIERKDFAAGTSSRSSKLIHGGLRYLQQGDVGLVREAATERYLVRKMAPHLAQPRQMLVPVASRRGWAKIKLGLWTFDRLAQVAETEQYRMISREETLELEPMLQPDRVYGAGMYYEYLTDDARLVIENVKSAAALGAIAVNHTEATGFVLANGKVSGVRVRDRLGGVELVARGRIVINACGPWVDHVRLLCETGESPRLHLTKGIHVGIAWRRLPLQRIVVMNARDHRGVFAVPKGEVTYLGTTDTDYEEPADYPEITEEDVAYLLDAAGRTFVGGEPGLHEVVSAWAGLRPLLQQEGKKPSEISRRDEIMSSSTGLLSVAGGKLTTFRRMGERIVDQAVEQLREAGRPVSERRVGTSEDMLLPGGETGEDVAGYASALGDRFPTVARELVVRLVDLYGSNAAGLVEQIATDPVQGERAYGSAVTRAEVEYAVRREMAMTLEDVLERRSRLLLWDPTNGLPAAAKVAEWMAEILEWSGDRVTSEVSAYGELSRRLRTFGKTTAPLEIPLAPAAASG